MIVIKPYTLTIHFFNFFVFPDPPVKSLTNFCCWSQSFARRSEYFSFMPSHVIRTKVCLQSAKFLMLPQSVALISCNFVALVIDAIMQYVARTLSLSRPCSSLWLAVNGFWYFGIWFSFGHMLIAVWTQSRREHNLRSAGVATATGTHITQPQCDIAATQLPHSCHTLLPPTCHLCHLRQVNSFVFTVE